MCNWSVMCYYSDMTYHETCTRWRIDGISYSYSTVASFMMFNVITDETLYSLSIDYKDGNILYGSGSIFDYVVSERFHLDDGSAFLPEPGQGTARTDAVIVELHKVFENIRKIYKNV